MAEAQNAFSYQQFQALAQIAAHLATATDVRDALTAVLDRLADACRMRYGVIALMNETGDEVQADITVTDMPQSTTDRIRYRTGEGVTGRVIETGAPVFLPRLKDTLLLNRSGLQEIMDPEKTAFFCLPISYRGTDIGTLSAYKITELITDAALETRFLREVALLIAPFVQRHRLEARLEMFQRTKQPGGTFGKLVGNSAAIRELQNLIVRVAAARTTVLITGETGAGKGVVAELIHALGPSRNEPFIELNCGAIPENLVESELFGHEQGAFTGATQRRIGVLERARRGTVFFDEIGELPLTAQTRLLRVLQNREFERVGGARTISTGARVIAASNRDLEHAIALGLFRADLFYRLNVFPLRVPALRERGKADIMLLVDFFIQELARQAGKKVTRIDTPAIDMLTAYHWPGNVRELENVIERAILLADGEVIHGHHLPPSLQLNRYQTRQEDHGNFTLRVRNFETELIVEALKDTNGNQTAAAAKLGITKRMIQYKIHKYGIDYTRFRGGDRQSSTTN